MRRKTANDYNAALKARGRGMVEDIKSRLAEALPNAEIAVAGEGGRCDIRVVCDEFEGVSRVKRQQRVYAPIADLIASGALHAVTIKATTRAESR